MPTDIEQVRYERRDVRLKPLLLSATALAGLLLVVFAAMAGLFGLFAEEFSRRPTAGGEISVTQTATARQLQRLRQREEKMLTTYGWVDQEKGVVRIPIAKAMELVVEERNEVKDDQVQDK